MIICMGCGNNETFHRTVHGYQNYTEVELVNGTTEDVDDWVDYDTQDGEVTDMDCIVCQECASEEIIEGLDESEMAKIKVKHTDKKGKWSEAELEPKDQNPEQIAELMMVI